MIIISIKSAYFSMNESIYRFGGNEKGMFNAEAKHPF
jgi:hypothetical protein